MPKRRKDSAIDALLEAAGSEVVSEDEPPVRRNPGRSGRAWYGVMSKPSPARKGRVVKSDSSDEDEESQDEPAGESESEVKSSATEESVDVAPRKGAAARRTAAAKKKKAEEDEEEEEEEEEEEDTPQKKKAQAKGKAKAKSEEEKVEEEEEDPVTPKPKGKKAGPAQVTPAQIKALLSAKEGEYGETQQLAHELQQKEKEHHKLQHKLKRGRISRLRWTLEEEEAILEGLKRYPDGTSQRWSKIRKDPEWALMFIAQGRVGTDIRDKWRNMQLESYVPSALRYIPHEDRAAAGSGHHVASDDGDGAGAGAGMSPPPSKRIRHVAGTIGQGLSVTHRIIDVQLLDCEGNTHVEAFPICLWRPLHSAAMLFCQSVYGTSDGAIMFQTPTQSAPRVVWTSVPTTETLEQCQMEASTEIVVIPRWASVEEYNKQT